MLHEVKIDHRRNGKTSSDQAAKEDLQDLDEFLNTAEGQAIFEVVEGLWKDYDDDNSGELDKEETREFMKD